MSTNLTFNDRELSVSHPELVDISRLISPRAHDSLAAEESGDSVNRHMAICQRLNDIYARKNADYGDSFHATYLEEGMAMARIRLSDKLSRFKRLTMSGERKVDDETVTDTLLDLANYAIMTVMEIEQDAAQ